MYGSGRLRDFSRSPLHQTPTGPEVKVQSAWRSEFKVQWLTGDGYLHGGRGAADGALEGGGREGVWQGGVPHGHWRTLHAQDVVVVVVTETDHHHRH